MPKCQAQHQLRKRIDLEYDRLKIQKLCLDQIPINSFTNITKRMLQLCVNLEYLTINACQLVSLINFPLLPSLITLELSSNKLSGNLRCLQTSRYITFLDLSSNQFQDITEINALSSLNQMEILIVGKNPIAQLPDYRQKLFAVLPTVKTIDCYDRNDQLLSSEGQESYITDKYNSLKNFDELCKQRSVIGNEREGIKSRQSLIDPQQQKKSTQSKCLQKMGIKAQILKNVKGRKRFLSDGSSQQEGPNSMIGQFKRKFRKQE